MKTVSDSVSSLGSIDLTRINACVRFVRLNIEFSIRERLWSFAWDEEEKYLIIRLYILLNNTKRIERFWNMTSKTLLLKSTPRFNIDKNRRSGLYSVYTIYIYLYRGGFGNLLGKGLRRRTIFYKKKSRHRNILEIIKSCVVIACEQKKGVLPVVWCGYCYFIFDDPFFLLTQSV